MSMAIGNYSNLFSSMNGSYNAASDMSNVISQRSQIQSGSYGKLMKAYVGKVGNKAALNAYRETGTTAKSVTEVSGASESSAASSSKATAKSVQSDKASKYASYKSNYLDSHLSSIGKAKTSSATASGKSFLDKHLSENAGKEMSGVERAIAYAEQTTGIKNPVTYNKGAEVSTAADPTVAIDTQL